MVQISGGFGDIRQSLPQHLSPLQSIQYSQVSKVLTCGMLSYGNMSGRNLEGSTNLYYILRFLAYFPDSVDIHRWRNGP